MGADGDQREMCGHQVASCLSGNRWAGIPALHLLQEMPWGGGQQVLVGRAAAAALISCDVEILKWMEDLEQRSTLTSSSLMEEACVCWWRTKHPGLGSILGPLGWHSWLSIRLLVWAHVVTSGS